MCSSGEGASVFDEAGKLLDSQRANEVFKLVWGIISDAFKYSNESCSDIPSDQSLKDFFIQKIGEKDLRGADKQLILQMAEMWGAFVGSPWERQSLKYFWLEECIDGGKLKCLQPGISTETDISFKIPFPFSLLGFSYQILLHNTYMKYLTCG